MEEDIKRRLGIIETKLDILITNTAVHSAVCDSDRGDLRSRVEENTTKLWKVALGLIGAGATGGGIIAALTEWLGV